MIEITAEGIGEIKENTCPDKSPDCKTVIPGNPIGGFDRCVVPELKALWAQGIKTECSCCGHGDPEKAFIVADEADADKMAALGYERIPEPYPMCVGCGGAFFRAKLTKE